MIRRMSPCGPAKAGGGKARRRNGAGTTETCIVTHAGSRERDCN
jgi:hypothetical protein